METEVLNLFPLTEEEKREERLNKIETRLGNVQRGVFARHNELHGMYGDLFNMFTEMKSDLESLKKMWGVTHEPSISTKDLAFYK